MLHHRSGLPTFCFKNVWKLCEVLDVHVTAVHRPSRHRPSQAQEVPAGIGRSSCFCMDQPNFFLKNKVKVLEFKNVCWLLCDGM